MRGALVAALVVVMLAGCAAESAQQVEEIPAAFEDIQVSSTKGAIRGLVLSETITPIEGAQVKLAGSDQVKTSDAQGAFVFVDLEAGDYFLSVSKPGYLAVQSTTTVVAGASNPPIVKVQLIVDQAAALLYAALHKWEGYMQCGFTVTPVVVGVGFNACGSLDGRFINNFEMGTLPTFTQAEMVWQSTQTLSPELNLGFYQGGVTNWNSVQGPSPLITSTTGDEIVDRRGNESDVLPMRVFPPYTVPFGLTIEQSFTVFLTMTFGFTPRADWLFIVDGACEPYTACA
jgi:hypothetical protein